MIKTIKHKGAGSRETRTAKITWDLQGRWFAEKRDAYIKDLNNFDVIRNAIMTEVGYQRITEIVIPDPADIISAGDFLYPQPFLGVYVTFMVREYVPLKTNIETIRNEFLINTI